jgi:uncharacterized membrane protein (DUF4010 family)
MDTNELFQRLTLALAIGLLIGLERGWQARQEAEGERAAGLRTHALIALLGGICGSIAIQLSDGAGLLLGMAFAVAGGTVVLFRFRETAYDGTLGATTAVAALLAFALGVLAVIGDRAAAAAAGVAVAGLLALKGVLHAWVRRLTWPELRSVLMLAAMSAILLPVLPRQPIDPMGAVNPFEIWLLTVMIAVISFAGYVSIKLTGAQRGIALTGIAGGLASSTAATLTLARLAGGRPEQSGLMAGGALLAGATMMVRVIVIAGVVEWRLVPWVLLPLGAAAAVTALIGVVLILRPYGDTNGSDSAEIAPRNPLDIVAILKFGALLTGVGVLTHFATLYAGTAGAYVIAALSGVADVDAITLSMARMAGAGLGFDAAAVAVLIAVGVNTLAKAVLGWIAGGRAFGLRLAGAAAVALAIGIGGYAAGALPLERLLPEPRTMSGGQAAS